LTLTIGVIIINNNNNNNKNMLVCCYSECISTPGRLEKYAWPRWESNLGPLKYYNIGGYNTGVMAVSQQIQPGGDVKMFTASDERFVFKWQGSKKKKIEIVKDHDDHLLSRLKNNAHEENKGNVTRENDDPIEHVLCAMSLPFPSPTYSEREKDETFLDIYCELEEKLEMVLSRLCKLEEKSQSEKRAQSLFVAENCKMAAEITCLTATVTELREEYENIRTLVGNKQNKWIQVESRMPNKPSTKTVTLIETDNRYADLAVEDPITESSPPAVEDFNDNNNDPKPTTSDKTRQNRDMYVK
jgi:hypothetical protein